MFKKILLFDLWEPSTTDFGTRKNATSFCAEKNQDLMGAIISQVLHHLISELVFL